MDNNGNDFVCDMFRNLQNAFLLDATVLQQEEIRYMLWLGSIFAVFRLTLRSMVQQLDSILEKATDGLFIPISENQIVKQFIVIPITIICGDGFA